MSMPVNEEIERLVRGEHHEPHRLLGAHPDGGQVRVRAWRPGAKQVSVLTDGGREVLERVHPAGLFEGTLASAGDGRLPAYRLEVSDGERVVEVEDPYRFLPTLGELDQHLIAEGRHQRLWERLGARPLVLDGVAGTAFAVWAPNARSVRVVGDFNRWDGRMHPMRTLGASGIWELFVPGVGAGEKYKYEVLGADGALVLKADPLARRTERTPATASVVEASDYRWDDGEWMRRRGERQSVASRISIYELHLGSWRQGKSYRELAEELPAYVAELGFTHVELLPLAEHPFDGSWGYQVTSYFAPTARFGPPDDLRLLIDRLHQRGIGVLMDWVPAHFPKDIWALARFDGTALYEHADPRRGEHPDWGSLVFNYGRNEVRNFLVA
ncbi:MAG TPA: alpha-amylase family glycosyl hydrolase, partial [Actinomycetota bacterium]